VLLLEDLHWADVTSLGLLLYLGRHLKGAHILVLGTYRDVEVGGYHPLEETLGELVRERLIEEVNLHRLGAHGTAAVIRDQLAAEWIAEELVTPVHRRAQGNPFFTEELLKALVEQGAVYEADGQWEHNAVTEIEVPHSVRSVVDRRVRRLTARSQKLLRLASVLGPEFDLEVLQVASALSETEILDSLDAALGARLLEERQRGAPDRLALKTLAGSVPGTAPMHIAIRPE
jgi:predicted ATPase